MAALAIKGHATRGKEVIEILKGLGGKNTHNYIANCESFYFYIDSKINNISYGWLNYPENSDVVIFTIEEFLEKFPYKVGNKVLYHECMSEIISMKWKDNDVVYTVLCKGTKWETVTNFLQPYIEQIEISIENSFKETNEVIFDTNAQCCDISNQIIKKETMKNGFIYDEIDFNRCPHADKVQLILGDDYEIKVEDEKTYVVKKKPKYPNTFEECCDVLGIEEDLWFVYEDIDGNHINPACISNYRMRRLDIHHNLEKLIICRDAYWKIAGEQMGLGKNWEYEMSKDEFAYAISYQYGRIQKIEIRHKNAILAFPTEQMRDTFFDNFKDLIESCKEIL